MANTQNAARDSVPCIDLLGWLRGKLADAEQALAAREQAAKCWKSGTNESWAAASAMHPDTAKLPPLTKAARMDNARREERIIVRLRRDVQNYQAVIETLSHPNNLIRRKEFPAIGY